LFYEKRSFFSFEKIINFSLIDHKIHPNVWDDDVQNEDDDMLFFRALEALAVLSKQRVVLRFFLSSFSV